MPDLPAERVGFPAPPALADIRAGIEAAAAAGTWRTVPPAAETEWNGVRALRFQPETGPAATIVHFHGGGYRMGCPEMMAPYAAALTERCGVELLMPAYRLAPDHPFPAALHDGLATIEAVRDRKQGPLLLAGDSAGGGLAASLTALCIRRGIEIGGLILHSPWLDLRLGSASYERNAGSDRLFSRAFASEAATLYLQGWPADDPLASPLLADLAGFPPTFLSVGAGEVLVDDSRQFHDALERAGILSRLLIIEDMEHVAITRGQDLTGARETFEALTDFLVTLLAGQPIA